MVNDRYGIKLLQPSNKLNFQYYTTPIKKSEAEVSLRENVISRGVFKFFTLPAWNDPNRVYAIEYIESYEQLKAAWVSDPNFKVLDNPVNATMTVYADSFQYDPVHGGTGGVQVDPMCDQNHQESHEQGFSRSPREFRNVEFTTYLFVDEVDASDGYVFIEFRSNNNHPGWESTCCSDHGYGIRLYTGEKSTYKGKIAFYKRTFSGGQKVLPLQPQTPTAVFDRFYQRYLGIKAVIYNPDPETNERVRMELYLSTVDWEHPEAESSNIWTKVGEIEDYVGKKWTSFGKECGADNDDQPITWAAPFVNFGWRKIRHARFMYMSFREIDILGNFGDDPIPPPDPETDPTIPPPDEPEPPVVEPPPPPDAEPPTTPTTLTKRLTLRREIINSSSCVCDGIKPDVGTPPDPPTNGGGGGTGTINELYNVALSTSGFARLAKVAGSTSLYLRFGQAVTMTTSPWIGKRIVRVEMTLAEAGDPRGGTGGGVFCRIRKAADDSIASTLNPVCTEENIKDAGIVHVFENLTNAYAMKFEDKLLFEYDGGDSANYVKVFRRSGMPNTGTKIVWQANADDPGDYHYDASFDVCMRVYYVTGQVSGNAETDYDVTVIKRHRYDVA